MLNGRRVVFGTVADGQILMLSGERIVGTSPSAPGAHATSHKHSGTDEVGTSTPAANAIPKADSSGCLPPGFQPIKLTLSADLSIPSGYGVHYPVTLTIPANITVTIAADGVLEIS